LRRNPFSRAPFNDKQQRLLALPVCFALWQDIRSATSLSLAHPKKNKKKAKLIQAPKVAR